VECLALRKLSPPRKHYRYPINQMFDPSGMSEIDCSLQILTHSAAPASWTPSSAIRFLVEAGAVSVAAEAENLDREHSLGLCCHQPSSVPQAIKRSRKNRKTVGRRANSAWTLRTL